MEHKSPEEISRIFAERLVALRKNHGYQQGYVADQLGILQATYSHYEHNRRQAPLAAVAAASRFYNVSTEYLLGMPEYKEGLPPKITELNEIAKSLLPDRLDQLLDFALFLSRRQSPQP